MSLSNVNVNDFGSVYVENVCFKNAIESMCPVYCSFDSKQIVHNFTGILYELLQILSLSPF